MPDFPDGSAVRTPRSPRHVVATRFAVPSPNGSCIATVAEIDTVADGEMWATAELMRHFYPSERVPGTMAREHAQQAVGNSRARLRSSGAKLAMKKWGSTSTSGFLLRPSAGGEIMFFVPAPWDPGVEELPCIS